MLQDFYRGFFRSNTRILYAVALNSIAKMGVQRVVAPAGAKSLRYSAFTSAFTSANWLSTSDSFTTDDGE